MEFYSKKIESSVNKVFLLGSSHIGHLNMTYIIDYVSKNNPNYTVYNLGENGDAPKIRHQTLSKIIKLKPVMVFYGVSYRDFNVPSETTDPNVWNPDIKQYVSKNVPNEFESINPQLLTRKAIRAFLNDTGIVKSPVYDIQPPNTPFFALGKLQTRIVDNDELQRQMLIVLPPPSKIQISLEENEETVFFKKIIKELQENNITVVIFTTPLPKAYLDEVSELLDSSFQETLNEIVNEYEVKIFDFKNKYSNLNIWNNPDHVAYNENSIVFSKELAEIISEEIED